MNDEYDERWMSDEWSFQGQPHFERSRFLIFVLYNIYTDWMLTCFNCMLASGFFVIHLCLGKCSEIEHNVIRMVV